MPDAERPVLPLTKDDHRSLRRVGALNFGAGLLWPVQAAAIAGAISGWVHGAPELTAVFAVVFLLAGLLRALLDHRAGGIAFRVANRIEREARDKVLSAEAHVLRDDVSSAEIAALLTQKIPLLAPYVTRYRPAMHKVRVLPLVLLALVFSQSWAAGLVLLVSGPLIPVFMALVGLAAKEASERQMAEIGDMNALLIDRIAALPDVLLLNGAGRSRRVFEMAADRLRSRTMAVLRVAFLSSTVLELFAAIGVAMVAVYVGFSLLGEITIGTWGAPLTIFQGVFILLLTPEFFQYLRDLASSWHDKAAADAVLADLDRLERSRPEGIFGAAQVAPALDGPACVRVSGAFVRRGARVLRLPDVEVGPGQSLAVAGPSGTGKSTLLDLVAGLVRAERGEVRVAGRVLDEATADHWRARCALVPQIMHVPDLTLAEFLDPHGTVADPAPALAQAHADGILRALPDGLATRLGEAGAGVSGGEMRRLALARAFLSGADVILADEPTADLDARSAALIIEALRAAVAGGRTLIVATHDPALMAAMDRTVHLEPSE
ncbi:ATP-binding cassette, subfamily C, CydD [Salinihabitans flavidus]|uniref:ATP-binding cassette, subfamily C, CydD n=1 Tax=Salinihabitans flavidus TaxID=569882 RepID=A0A1H8RBP3_9RHOB|nr:thiol reductant ABC exporter subunit CydD [Salinihabitans flavidus]SEO63820.1 ATP-binding cassette, subfamily C, CydD [Salinihabitans flavidus]